MITANTALFEEVSALYKREAYSEILSRITLEHVIQQNHPHLFYFYAKAQQALEVNPYAVIETCTAAIEAFPDFTTIQIVHFYALQVLDNNDAAAELGIALYHANVTDIQFLLDLAALLKQMSNSLAGSVQYQAHFKISEYYYHRGDFRQAEEAAAAACELPSELHEAHLLAVKILLAQGRLGEAQQKAEQYQVHEDIHYDISRLLINLYRHTNNPRLLETAITDFISRYPDDGYAQKVNYLHERTQKTDSENLNHLNKNKQIDELDSWWVVQRAKLMHKLSFDPTYLNLVGEDFWTRMQTLVETGVVKHALEQAVIELEKRSSIKHFVDLCQLVFDRNEIKELYAFFQSRLEILKTHPELRCLYARCLANVESYDSAFRYLTNEQQCTPHDEALSGCLASLTLSYFTMNEANPTEAANLVEYSQYFQENISKKPNDSLSLYYLGYVRLAEMNFDEALTLLSKARSIGLVGANVPFNAYWIAYTEFKLEKHEDALSTFESWFEKRVYKSFNITEHLQLKTLISETIKQKQKQFENETKPLKTPFGQRIVFCLVALLINALLYNIDLSNSLVPSILLKLLAALGAAAVVLWTVNGFKYQQRKKDLLAQPND
jgi:hypothetical protein